MKENLRYMATSEGNLERLERAPVSRNYRPG
jgi:hypothetical protein